MARMYIGTAVLAGDMLGGVCRAYSVQSTRGTYQRVPLLPVCTERASWTG